MDSETLLEQARKIDASAEVLAESDMPSLRIPVERLKIFLTKLRDAPQLAFDMLFDHAAVDWIDDNRFELVYYLTSTSHGHDIMISTDVPRDNPTAPTVSDVWTIAQWQEREVYDLFGVRYEGHPDLRRLFLEDDWEGYPLRKDYKDDFMLEKP